jgi:hypothetical protein
MLTRRPYERHRAADHRVTNEAARGHGGPSLPRARPRCSAPCSSSSAASPSSTSSPRGTPPTARRARGRCSARWARGDLILLAIGAVIGAGHLFGAVGTAAAGEVLARWNVMVRYGRWPRRWSCRSCCWARCAASAALCYAELASMIPQAGSAYAYSYATLGELVAWIIGWDVDPGVRGRERGGRDLAGVQLLRVAAARGLRDAPCLRWLDARLLGGESRAGRGRQHRSCQALLREPRR